MTSQIHLQHLSELPTVREYLQNVGDTLRQGISVLLLTTPVYATDLLEECLRAALLQHDLLYEEIDLMLQPEPVPPLDVLRKAIFWDETQYQRCHTLDDLLSSDGLPDVLFIRNLTPGLAAQHTNWLDFIWQWSEAVHSLVGRRSSQAPALLTCLALPPEELSLRENPRLRVTWWWSMTTALDVRMLIRLRQRPDSSISPAESIWREYVLPPLAGADVEIVSRLWAPILLDVAGLSEHLRDLATTRGWTTEKLRSWRAAEFVSPRNFVQQPTLPLPKRERVLWSVGALDYVDEFGLTLSSAALALLGDEDGLRHRLWRGQAALVLPTLDELRIQIAEELTRLNGITWIVDWLHSDRSRADELIAAPLAVEWGELEVALHRAPYHSKAMLPAVQHARSVRNRLAHYQPVSYQDYALLFGHLHRRRG